jgi:hypothetical protein
MKTTGVLLEAFAAWISQFSRSEIDAMPNSSRSVISIPDPVHGLFHFDGQPLLLSCMANTDTKINKGYMNVITRVAACCG